MAVHFLQGTLEFAFQLCFPKSIFGDSRDRLQDRLRFSRKWTVAMLETIMKDMLRVRKVLLSRKSILNSFSCISIKLAFQIIWDVPRV